MASPASPLIAQKEVVTTSGACSPSSEEHHAVDLEPHQEMSYQPRFPSVFTMYCDKASDCGGGESGVTDMRAVT